MLIHRLNLSKTNFAQKQDQWDFLEIKLPLASRSHFWKGKSEAHFGTSKDFLRQ